jgi:hypothetical protein
MKNTKQLGTGEYEVDWEEIGDTLVLDGWQKYVKGDNITRREAVDKDIENQGVEERTMFVVYAMAKRLMAMEKTIKRMEKLLKEKGTATK